MDLEGWHRACVAFRVKLSRDTGVNITAAVCELLLGGAFPEGEGGEEASLWRDPGMFYASLGAAIANQTLPLVIPDHEKVAWYCYREAAGVHKHPVGMRILAGCLFRGQGVTEDPAQAFVWYQKAADLGDVSAKASLGAFLLHGDARAGVAQDAARGFALLPMRATVCRYSYSHSAT
jgi:TPR repeat protein